MRFNKKLNATILTFLACSSLIGCSNENNTNTPGNEEQNNGEKDDTTSYTKQDYSSLPYVSSLTNYKKDDFTASYIWAEKSIPNSYVAFRKSFTLNEKVDKATAYISAESKYYLRINEKLVVFDGPYKRGLTMYDGYYDEVEIGEYLVTGENHIVVLVTYNGRSSNSYVDVGQAGFIFESKIGNLNVITDSSWKVNRLKAYKNSTLLKENWPNYDQAYFLGEWDVYYDARDSVGDYIKNDFDDSSWSNAKVVGKVGYQPFNDLYPSFCKPFGFDEIKDISSALSYLNKEITEKTTLTFHLDENMQFSLYFELNSKNDGARITYYTNTYISQGIGSFKDDYVAKAGNQSYESYAWRSGTDVILEVDPGITFTKIGYRRSYFDSDKTGEFTSDNLSLNTLWDKAYNTLKICMRDSFMDCPERERSPYIGDSTNQIGEAFYSLDENSYEMIKKTMLTILGWTTANNEIPIRSPSKTLNENPQQTLAYFTSVYEYLLYTNDKDTVAKFYPLMINYLKLWNMKSSGLIEQRTGSFAWIDWGDGADGTLIQECWYYYALQTCQKIAANLNIKDDTTTFVETRLNSIKNAFESNYRKDGGYSSSNLLDDRANALCVLTGLAKEDSYSDIINVLTTVKGASPYMEKYVLEALCILGKYKEAESRILDRYDAMIKDTECSTLYELWTKDAGTINHGWTGGPLTIMSKYFAGISPLTNGYETYEITPQNMYTSLSAKTHTIQGDISYKLNKVDDKTTIVLTTIDAAGTLKLNKSFGSTVTISGDSYTKENDDGDYYVYSLNGTNYSIEIA